MGEVAAKRKMTWGEAAEAEREAQAREMERARRAAAELEMGSARRAVCPGCGHHGCPRVGSFMSRVRGLIRYRRCEACGRRVTTVERLGADGRLCGREEITA